MYIAIYTKVWINGDTHGEVLLMLDIGVKQRCPHSPALFILYIDEFETYFDEINGILRVYLTQ